MIIREIIFNYKSLDYRAYIDLEHSKIVLVDIIDPRELLDITTDDIILSSEYIQLISYRLKNITRIEYKPNVKISFEEMNIILGNQELENNEVYSDLILGDVNGSIVSDHIKAFGDSKLELNDVIIDIQYGKPRVIFNIEYKNKNAVFDESIESSILLLYSLFYQKKLTPLLYFSKRNNVLLISVNTKDSNVKPSKNFSIKNNISLEYWLNTYLTKVSENYQFYEVIINKYIQANNADLLTRLIILTSLLEDLNLRFGNSILKFVYTNKEYFPSKIVEYITKQNMMNFLSNIDYTNVNLYNSVYDLRKEYLKGDNHDYKFLSKYCDELNKCFIHILEKLLKK